MQAVFLAYMVVLKKTANVAVAAVLIVVTASVKMTYVSPLCWRTGADDLCRLTRICRVQYERDDILEADIICGTSSEEPASPSDSVENIASVGAEPEGQRKAREKVSNTVSGNTDFWTMKLATKIRFSYATIPSRPQRARRQPNPFQPEVSTSAMPGYVAISMKGAGSGPSHTGSAFAPREHFPSAIDVIKAEQSPERQPVTLCSDHPPHPAWDDDSCTEQGYENPYYTRTINDVLWLPRDSLGTLDLDDTVNLRVSITSEPGAGKLGSWSEEDFIGSSITLPSALSSVSFFDDDDTSIYGTVIRRINGDEVINLPSGIASRVEHLEQEHDVEETRSFRRPSIIQRRTSSTASQSPTLTLTRSTSPSLTFRRPSTLDVGPSSNFRSFSLGSEDTRGAGHTPTSASTHASSDRRRRNRASTMDATSSLRPIIVRPTVNRQASRSLLSVVQQPQSEQSSRLLPSPCTSSIISTRDAVVGEVIVEEQEATQERMRQEEEEAQKAKQPRSLLTAWMFARARDAEATPP